MLPAKADGSKENEELSHKGLGSGSRLQSPSAAPPYQCSPSYTSSHQTGRGSCALHQLQLPDPLRATPQKPIAVVKGWGDKGTAPRIAPEMCLQLNIWVQGRRRSPLKHCLILPISFYLLQLSFGQDWEQLLWTICTTAGSHPNEKLLGIN